MNISRQRPIYKAVTGHILEGLELKATHPAPVELIGRKDQVKPPPFSPQRLDGVLGGVRRRRPSERAALRPGRHRRHRTEQLSTDTGWACFCLVEVRVEMFSFR